MSSIKLKLVLWIVGISIMTAAITGGVVLFQMRQPLTDQVTQRGVSLARNLASNAAESLLMGDAGSELSLMAMAGSMIREHEGLVYATIVDAAGIIRGHSDIRANLSGKSYTPPPGLEAAGGSGNVKFSWYQDPKAGLTLDVEVRVTYRDREETLGFVHVGLAESVIRAALEQAGRIGLIAVGGAAVLGMLVSILLAGFLAKPIQVLERGVQAIGAGNLETVLPVTSRDELGRLAGLVNEMTKKVKEAQSAMVDKARLEQDVRTANRLQSLLLPKAMPNITGYAVASTYRAARFVGGDYYDVLPQGSKLHLVIADVAGKGVPGLIGMSLCRNAMRSSMGLYPSASKVLSRANEIIFDDLSREMFISAFYAILDMPTRTLVCANAGHHPLMIFRKATKTVERVLKVGGMALRMGRGAPFVQALSDMSVQLQPGDIAFFYTDGLSEAMGPKREEFGEARVETAVLKYGNNTVDDFLKRIEAEVSNHRAGTEPNDDLTMMALKAL